MRSRISPGAMVASAGFGFAIVGLVLPYLVKEMPESISIPLVAVGGLMIVVPAALWLAQRMKRPDPTLPATDVERLWPTTTFDGGALSGHAELDVNSTADRLTHNTNIGDHVRLRAKHRPKGVG